MIIFNEGQSCDPKVMGLVVLVATATHVAALLILGAPGGPEHHFF